MVSFMLYPLLSLALLFFSIQIQAEEKRLSLTDVHNEMNRILQVHVTQNTMSGSLVKSALSNYIDQFDPSHVYLLEGDVQPFTSLSEKNLELLVEQYNREDYAIFEKLNSVIQKAIKAMQSYRKTMIVNDESIKALVAKSIPKDFAKTRQELESRQAIYVAHLISAQVKSMQALERSISLQEAQSYVEVALRENEDDYFYVDNKGEALPSAQRDSLFAAHILQAFTKSLDVHSKFLNPRQAKNVRMTLEKEYVGVGLGIQPMGKRFIVSEIVKGSSAQKSGKVRLGDEILSIDGSLVEGLSSDIVLSMLQGKPDTAVRISFYGRNRGRFDVTLLRQLVVLEEGRVDARYLAVAGGILAVVQLHGFYQGKGGVSSDQDLRTAVQMLKKKGTIKGMVLDLRDNHGGFLQQAVKVAGLFIKCGVIVVAKDAFGKLYHFRDLDSQTIYNGPLVVLVSKETASAAEIVAQSLKDYGVAVVVGDPETFGKGSIQLQTDLASTVTIGRYYSVSGISTQLEGVKADVVVPGPLAKTAVGEEFLVGTLSKDRIAASYNDSLSDIPKEEKARYERYYLPFLQKKEDKYRKWIPDLVNLSQARVAKNDNYQNLLRGNFTVVQGEGKNAKKITLDFQAAEAMLSDLQSKEAVAILQDLMLLSGSR